MSVLVGIGYLVFCSVQFLSVGSHKTNVWDFRRCDEMRRDESLPLEREIRADIYAILDLSWVL